MARCYKYIDLDGMVTGLFSIARKTGPLTSTDDISRGKSLEMYKQILKLLENRFFDGDIKPTLDSVIRGENPEFLQVWDALQLKNIQVRTRHAKVGNGNPLLATDYNGIGINMNTEVFEPYIEEGIIPDNPIPATPTPTPKEAPKPTGVVTTKVDNETVSDDDVDEIFPTEEANDEDLLELAVGDDTRSIRSLIRDLLGSKRAGMQDDLIGFFRNIISTTYVDNVVREDGSVKGFESITDVATTVKQRLGNITSNFIRKSADDVIDVRDKDGFGTILFFEPGRPMSGAYEVKTVYDEEGGSLYTEYAHPMLKHGEDTNYRIVVPFDPDDTVDTVADYISIEEDIDMDNMVVDEDHVSSGITIDSAFGASVETNQTLKNVFFANAILKGRNFDTFLRAFNKPLHTAYKEQHRSGHGHDGTFSAEDQDTKTIRLLKTTTPRIIQDNNGNLSFSETDPFLTEQDFNTVAYELHKLPRDLQGFSEGIQKLITTNKSESDVYSSIYYRFFAPEDYSVINNPNIASGKTTPAVFRSLNSILNKNSYSDITGEQFKEVANDYAAQQELKSGNALLANAMSALLTSMNSTTPAEKVLSKNNRMQTTNMKGGETAVIRKQDFVSRTTESRNGSRYTQDKLLKKITITSSKNNTLKFRIAQPGTKGFYNFTAKISPVGDKLSAKDGRFIKSLTSNVVLAPVQMQQIAKQFNVPAELTSAHNIPIIKQILSANFKGEEDTIFNNFMMNLIMSTALNGRADSKVTGPILKMAGMYTPAHQNADGLRYDPFGVNRAFRQSLGDIFGALSGRQIKKYIISNNGDKLASLIPKNKVKDTENLVKKLAKEGTLHHGRLITSGKYLVGETYSKTGIKIGEDGKGNGDMTRLEQNQFLIEQAFLGRLEETNWKSALFQMGTMSDRSDIQLVDLTVDTGNYMPIKNGGLDMKTLMNDSYNSKSAYFNNVEKQTTGKWASYLSKKGIAITPGASIFEVAKKVNEAQLDFDEVQAESGLVGNSMLGKAGKYATIPNSTLQNIALFKDEKLAKKFLRQNLSTFLTQMKGIGYDSITKHSADVIGKQFGAKMSNEDARKVLLTAYYFYSSTLGTELLDMHTGGFIQFKSRAGNSTPVDNLFAVKADGTTEMKAPATVLEQFKKRNVVDKRDNKAKRLSKFSVKTASEVFGIDSEEVYQLAIIKNKNLTDEQKAELLLISDISLGNHLKYVDQVKRNAGMGSSNQLPRLAGKNEAGVYLGQNSHNITVDDPTAMIKLLGKSGEYKQDIYDAVQMAHPLYFLKLNGSIGDTDSNFRASGVAVKDITNEIDEEGWFRFQKKATFDVFNNEMLQDGSPELYTLFEKMNTAMEFTNKVMMVPTGNSEFAPLTTQQWLSNGLSLGLILDTKTGTMVDAKSIVSQMSDARFSDEFAADLAKGRYHTTLQEVSFDNMHDLWEFFGAFENSNAWNQISELLGNHAGNATNIDLSDATYANRDAYIEKVGFVSQEKTGGKNIIPSDVLHDPAYRFVSSDQTPRWSTIDNTYHGVILQAEHSPDSTGSMKGSVTYDGDHGEDSTVSLITQIISANVGQGESLQESSRIYNTLNTLSSSFLLELADKLAADARHIGEESGFDESQMEKIEDVLQNISDKEYMSKVDPNIASVVDKSLRNYVTDIVRESLKTREDAGTTGELLSDKYIDRVSFDLKMTLPLAQSSINSKFNRGTVRMKFKGGQFVVSPSHDYIKSYTLGGRGGMNRTELNKTLFSEFMPRTGGINPELQAELAALPSTPITTLEQLNALKPSDLLLGPNNEVTNILTLKKRFRDKYEPVQGQNFENMFKLDLISQGNYSTKLIDANGALQTPEDGRLKWQSYYKYSMNEAGEMIKINAADTKEYTAFNAVDTIEGIYSNTLKKLAGTGEVPGSPGYEIAMSDAMNKVPINEVQFREFWFKSGPGAEYAVDGEYTPAQQAEMSQMFSDLQQAEVIYDSIKEKTTINLETIERAEKFKALKQQVARWIGESANADPFFRKVFEKNIYDVMEDRTGETGWVAEPAEFYMPSMHQKAFFIEDGDNLLDILGTQEQPDSKPLVSLGIIDTDEAFELERDFVGMSKKLRIGTSLRTPQQEAALNKYLNAKEAQLQNMRGFFKTKLKKAYGGPNPLNDAFVFKSTDNLNKLAAEVSAKIARVTPGSDLYNAYLDLHQSIIDEVKASRKAKRGKHTPATGARLTQVAIIDYINAKKARLANNFTHTLEFITARIPAQGKQSYISAKTKNFIHHTKNSCYGPLEMLTITGADYDIDKQNMMVWAVDTEGNIVDWKEHLNADGNFVRTAITSKIEEVSLELTNRAQVKADALVRTITKLEENVNKAATPEDAAVVQEKLEAARNQLEEVQPELTKQIANAKKSLEESFVMAGQNYVVYNLMKTIKDPKNAVEAATPVSMDKVGSGKSKNDYRVLEKSNNVTDFLIAHDFALPYDPYTFTNYERINMDGKSAVGIFASDLKSYFATYYAFINSTADESHLIAFDSQLGASEAVSQEYGIQDNAIQFFKATTDNKGNIESLVTQNITELANTAKHLTNGKKLSTKMDRLKVAISKSTPEGQVTLLTKHITEIKQFDSMKVEEQAWEDLSELLSAATDNAKELILGRIGANNNTNSIISTMIRLGVDLKDALAIINHPKVKPLVAQVESQGDLQLKAKAKEEAAGKSQLYEDGFSTLEKVLKDAVGEETIPEKPGKLAMEYLADPVRQMLTFTEIASEFSTVAKMLGINQGLPNGAYESWDFIDKIDKSINKTLSKETGESKGDPFDLKKFVNMAIRANANEDVKAKRYIHGIMDRYNAVKNGINVPYVLFKNSHYFSYFQAAFEAKAMRDRTSQVFKTVEDIIDSARSHAGEDIRIEDTTFKRVADFVYASGIQKYFSDSTYGGKIRLHGTDYDLSTAEGRLVFLEEFPFKFQESMDGEFKDNDFMLFKGEPLIDYATKKKIEVLRGPDLNNIDSMLEAKLDNALNNENDGLITDPELYDALFAYGLIVGKGGYNKGSFIGLFAPEKYMEFVDFISANSGEIIRNISSIPEVVRLNNPMLLPSISTTAKDKSKKSTKAPDEDEYFDDGGYDPNAGYGDEEGAMQNRRSYTDVSYKAFDTKNANKLRLAGEPDKPKGPHTTHDYVRSKQTGIIQYWDKNLQVYVPLIREIADVAIPFTLKDKGLASHVAAGYTEGWDVKLPGNQTGKVLAYVDSYVKGHAKKNLTLEKLFTPSLGGVDVTDKNKEFYIVRNDNGNYEVYEQSDLREENPNAVLKQHKIIVQQDDAEYKQPISTFRNVYQDSSGRLFNTSGPGLQPSFITAEAAQRTRGNSPAIYNEEFFKENILSAFTKDNTEKYDKSKVTAEYTKWRMDFAITALAHKQNISTDYAARLIAKPYTMLSNAKNAAADINRHLNRIAPPGDIYDNIAIALKTMQGGKKGFKDALEYYLQGTPKETVSTAVFPKSKTISAVKQIFQDKSFVENLSLDELSTMINGRNFDKYMNQVYMPGTEYKMVSMSNDRVYAAKDTRNSDDILAQLSAEESREYTIPNDLRAMYSKETSPAVMKKMAKYLNSRFPETKWRAISTAEIEATYGSRLAKAKGFVVNGEVILNTDKATLETPIHEYSHIYLAHLKESDRKLYDHIMNLSLKHPLTDSISDAYPELKSTDLGEEVFVELVSLQARGQLDETNPEYLAVAQAAGDEKGFFSKILSWFNEVFGDMFGSKAPRLNLTMTSTLNDAINQVGDRLAFGTDSILNDFSKSTKRKIKKVNAANTLNITEARELLKNQGFIQYRCD